MCNDCIIFTHVQLQYRICLVFDATFSLRHTWFNASNYCEEKIGTNLASFHSSKDIDMYKQLLKDQEMSNRACWNDLGTVVL